MNRRGFTIVEIIIVITIMGALLILAVVNLRGSQISAHDAERKTDIETISLHLDNYYTTGSDYSQSVGKYPSTVLTSGQSLQVLVVAGGGGGGVFGGGGGGGGLIYSAYPAATGSITVTVGGGGTGAQTYAIGGTGSNGVNSTFGSITATGGGGGGSRAGSPYFGVAGAAGGSGGGGSPADGPPVGAAGSASPSGQGSNGGSGAGYGWGGGGGGGAGGNGGNATAGRPSIGGNGGGGVAYLISGSSVYYAGGGGGCANDTGIPGSGGIGGGGAGAKSTGAGNGVSGTANTGGGGGGAGAGAYVGGNGGSGIVIISYPTNLMTATGGIITTNGLNTIHKFTSGGTFTINSINNVAIDNIQHTLRDIATDSITAPGITDPTQTFISATNNVQATTGVTPQPTIDQYVYQPLQSDGTLCTLESQDCRKFNLYYRLEADNTVYMVTGKKL